MEKAGGQAQAERVKVRVAQQGDGSGDPSAVSVCGRNFPLARQVYNCIPGECAGGVERQSTTSSGRVINDQIQVNRCLRE